MKMVWYDDIWIEASRRHDLHIDHPSHRPLSDGYELVGLRGEEAMADFLGCEVDMSRKPNGDGGWDFVVDLMCKTGVREIRIDVKTARKAFNLLVENGKVRNETIYVLARYSDDMDQATLIGWEWGVKIGRSPLRHFSKSVLSHFIPARHLRPMREIADRIVRGPERS